MFRFHTRESRSRIAHMQHLFHAVQDSSRVAPALRVPTGSSRFQSHVNAKGGRHSSDESSPSFDNLSCPFVSGDPILSVTLTDGNTIIWKGFDSDTALDSALALMEHLTGH